MTDFSKQIGASIDDGSVNDMPSWLPTNTTAVIGASASYSYDDWFRFTSVTIPAGATIVSAIVRFFSGPSQSATICNVNLYFENADSAPAPGTRTDLLGRPLTSAVAWNNLPAWTLDSTYDTPDLSSILQDVIDRGGWSSGNALMLHVRNNSSTAGAYRAIITFDAYTGKSAELIVSYTEANQISKSETIILSEFANAALEFKGEVAGVQNLSITENLEVGLDKLLNEGDDIALSEFVGVDLEIIAFDGELTENQNVAIVENVDCALEQAADLTLSILANADDGESFDLPYFSDADTYLNLGGNSGYVFNQWLRFDNAAIPANAIITGARLKFRCKNNSTIDPASVKIHFEDADDPDNPTDRTDQLGRDLTPGLEWSKIEDWIAGNDYYSPDISDELQIVVDRGGWSSGQALIVHIIDNGSAYNGYRQFVARDDVPANAAKLEVIFTLPLSYSDTIAVSESTAIDLEFTGELETSENIAVTENVLISLVDPSLAVDDGIDVAENVALEFYSYLHEPQAGDDVGISENVDVSPIGILIDTYENIGVATFGAGFPLFNETAETMQIGDSIEAFNWSKWFAANKNKAIPRYYCTLTGAADATTDVQIPISSLQARKRNGEPTFLSVVVPGFAYAQEITDRANGEIIITIGYEINGIIEFSEEILRATLEEIRIDEGPTNRAISLSGNKTQTFSTQIATVENSIYRSIQGNNIVHRFAQIDPFLNPGDTCRTGADEFTVDYIIYMVNSYGATMEVREG